MEQTASDTSACPTPDSKTSDSETTLSSSSQLLINQLAADIRAKEPAHEEVTEVKELVEKEPVMGAESSAPAEAPLPPTGEVRRHKRSALRLSDREIYRHRYSDEQKKFLVRCSAEFIVPSEVKILFRDKFKTDAPDNLSGLMHQYKKTYKWKQLFEETRKKYLEDLNEVPGTHKRVRMDRREKIYAEAMKQGVLKYALAATKDQELEIEGPKREMQVTFNQFNQYNQMTDEELEEKKQEILEKLNRKKSIDIKGETNGSSG